MNGVILGNRYELLQKIGEGGMSEVFKARCNKLNRFVAVKILKKEFCDNEEIVEKFKGEATAIAKLNDSNIVNILDVGTQEDINYIVMELVDGKTLKEIIQKTGKMNYESAIVAAIQVAKALDCAHRNKIIHRDVKPQNILVADNGVIKVTDFGIAKSTTSSTITNTSTIMGSAHYLSPEQAKGGFIDYRTDLYSLGVVIYEMVTGALPFEADTAVTIALKHLQEQVVPPKNINAKIPDSLNKLILKCMEKEPNKRYQTAQEVIKDLEKIKENPNAVIDKVCDDQHTIIMSAVTEEIAKQSAIKTVSTSDNDYDDYDDDYDDYDDEDEFKEKKFNGKKTKKILLGVGGGIFLILLCVGIFTLVSSGVGKEVELPNIIGMTLDEAKSKLEGMELTLVDAGSEKSDEPEGTIIKSDPKAGSSVKAKSKIRVIVSSGQTKVKMPDLREEDTDTANKILQSLNLKIDNVTEEYSDDVPKGQIISQNPSKNTEIDTTTKISVVVSKGAQVRLSTVPNVIGLSLDDAKDRLDNAKLKISIVEKETNDESKNGIVLSQSIEGSKVQQWTTVTITIGKYVAPVAPTPNPGDNNNGNNNNNNGNNGNNNNGNNNNNEGPTNPGDTGGPTKPPVDGDGGDTDVSTQHPSATVPKVE
ncbi:Stk1 family PASTA domain-containing Ser/Thr kinase [Clostridium botulinum]|uniref:Stk1 family PASTA domain-containing Ser/Thr kinase n=1 Tax=Clostridium sp. ZBS20 TaxID=2949966 RepID=UPI00207928CE|nr:Stk1 family PASTA domain-containing Ser/Thr kinase [Clostridium sp. ZBS20]MBN1051573.1 Stk1 family PASTA domain-containing Ser/Thr kinase [Clostridium botulinum]